MCTLGGKLDGLDLSPWHLMWDDCFSLEKKSLD